MKKAITDAIALLQKAKKATSKKIAEDDVRKAIDILEKALTKKSGDGGDNPLP